ncbi:MAG: sugar nucleotide-binding protein [Planctomycetota bacterium]
MMVILGASGFLGRYLFDRFRQDGLPAVGTYCRHPQPDMIPFELGRTDVKTLLPHRPSHVLVSAAVHPDPEATAVHPDEAREINVNRTRSFIRDCLDLGIVPVFASTDNVFDGEKGHYSEADSTNPLNLYGQMKCDVEQTLLESSRPFLLLRFGKVFRATLGDPALYTNIAAGSRLRLATDQVYTPLFIEDLYAFVRDAAANGWTGTYHLASAAATTRYDIAQRAARFLRVENVNIEPCSIDALGLAARRPKRIDLDVSKAAALTGRGLRPVEDFLGMVPR